MHNHDSVVEIHKEEAVASGYSPELMKNATFQTTLEQTRGPGQQ